MKSHWLVSRLSAGDKGRTLERKSSDTVSMFTFNVNEHIL